MKLIKKIILLSLSTLISTSVYAEQQEQEAIKKNIEILKEKTLSDESIREGGGTCRPLPIKCSPQPQK